MTFLAFTSLWDLKTHTGIVGKGQGQKGLGAGSLKYVKCEYIIVKRSHRRGRESTSAHQCKRDVRVRKLPVGTPHDSYCMRQGASWTLKLVGPNK